MAGLAISAHETDALVLGSRREELAGDSRPVNEELGVVVSELDEWAIERTYTTARLVLLNLSSAGSSEQSFGPFDNLINVCTTKVLS